MCVVCVRAYVVDVCHLQLLTFCRCQLALKLVLNIVTTGAQVQCGNVFRNFMINLTVSNNKLFHRAAQLVQQLTSAHIDECYASILRGRCA